MIEDGRSPETYRKTPIAANIRPDSSVLPSSRKLRDAEDRQYSATDPTAISRL
jgi:hypothetical protein